MTQCRYCPSRYVTQAELEEHERECSRDVEAFKTASELVRRWHEHFFGMQIDDWKLTALTVDIAKAIVAGTKSASPANTAGGE